MLCDEAMPKHSRFLKSQLLLDGGKLQGSFFHRSVVLICEHNAEGAFGVVLNRPTSLLFSSVVERELPARLTDEKLFGGGPVSAESVCYLFCPTSHASPTVLEDIALGHDLDELLELAGQWPPLHPVRLFQGYAGWAPGQLEDEIARDAWLIHPASSDLVFFNPPEQLWRHILRMRPGWKDRLLADAPDDLSWN